MLCWFSFTWLQSLKFYHRIIFIIYHTFEFCVSFRITSISVLVFFFHISIVKIDLINYSDIFF